MRTILGEVDTSTPAVVLKLDANVMHHGGLGAIRTLGRLGVPVYGVHEGPLAPAASSRYLRGRWFWRPDPEDTERLREGLLRLARQIGRPAVLIPTDDAGAIFLAEQSGCLRDWYHFPAPPPDLPRKLAGKYSLYQLCHELNVPCPQACVPTSAGEADEFAAHVGFPLIAKLATPWKKERHGTPKLRSTSIVGGAAELAEIARTSELAGVGLMLQEFIPGGQGHDWFFHGYCDAGSECRPAFTGVKERSYPAHAGLTSLGRSVSNTSLRRHVTRLLARLSYQGIVDLDLRLDARDGQYKLLDFNPRVGAQFRLFRDAAGVDVVLAAYLDLTGAANRGRDRAGSGHGASSGQVDDRKFLVENYDPISALRYWRDGELGLRSWAASMRGVSETAWFARDDLRPFGLMCVRMASRSVTRPFARGGHRAAPTEPRYRRGRAAATQPSPTVMQTHPRGTRREDQPA